MCRTELAHGNTPGIGQAAQRFVAALRAFEDFAGDVAPSPVFLGSGRQGFAGPIEGDLHIGQSAEVEAFRDHASSPSCRGVAVPDLVVYNASGRARGAFLELVAADVANAIAVSAFGGFLVAQQAAKRMLPNKRGAILFTGASASVKGYPQSAPFAMGKFALRGLAQSMARELSPQGIHIAHFVIDGGIRSAARTEAPDRPDSMLDPDAIALSYWNVLQQPRSAWTWELELRPWVEKF